MQNIGPNIRPKLHILHIRYSAEYAIFGFRSVSGGWHMKSQMCKKLPESPKITIPADEVMIGQNEINLGPLLIQ